MTVKFLQGSYQILNKLRSKYSQQYYAKIQLRPWIGVRSWQFLILSHNPHVLFLRDPEWDFRTFLFVASCPFYTDNCRLSQGSGYFCPHTKTNYISQCYTRTIFTQAIEYFCVQKYTFLLYSSCLNNISRLNWILY